MSGFFVISIICLIGVIIIIALDQYYDYKKEIKELENFIYRVKNKDDQ